MKENMRVIYDEDICEQIQSVDEIHEDTIEILELLKELNIPYEKEIRMKLDSSNYDGWEERAVKYLAILVAEENLPKVRENIPEELCCITKRFSELSEEEKQRLNTIDFATEEDKIIKPIENYEASLEKVLEDKRKRKNIEAVGVLCALSVMIVFLLTAVIAGAAATGATPNEKLAELIFGIGILIMLVLTIITGVARHKLKKAMSEAGKFSDAPIFAQLLKPAIYTQNGMEDILQDTAYKEIYGYKKFASKNKISDENENYIAAEVTLQPSYEVVMENAIEFQGIVVKTKSKKHFEEGVLVEIVPDGMYSKNIRCEVYKELYEADASIISEDFKERAQELDKKYGMLISLYYFGDVVFIMIDAETFDLKSYEISAKNVEEIEAKLKGKIELIKDYIELADLI